LFRVGARPRQLKRYVAYSILMRVTVAMRVVLLAALVTGLLTIATGSAATEADFSNFPVPTRTVRPPYPAIARAKKLSGLVLVDVVVNAGGAVTEATGLTNDELLRNPARLAAKQWRFKPLASDTRAYTVRLTFIFHDYSYVAPSKTPDFVSPYQMEIPYPLVHF
jgi:TonB family protein